MISESDSHRDSIDGLLVIEKTHASRLRIARVGYGSLMYSCVVQQILSGLTQLNSMALQIQLFSSISNTNNFNSDPEPHCPLRLSCIRKFLYSLWLYPLTRKLQSS